MEFFRIYSPIIFGLLIAFAVALGIASHTPAPLTYRAEPTFSETENVIPFAPPKIETPTTTPTVATSTGTTTKPVTKPKKPLPQTKVATSSISTVIQNVFVPPPQPAIDSSFTAVNESARLAVVNILCLAEAGTGLPSFSGSGLMIDSRGIVVTNAHVAEHMLLKDYKMKDAIKCTVRTGSPARDSYKAELMYLPPSWVEKNANQITSPSPHGTGEEDYAFLHITASATDTPLPFSFPALPIEDNETLIHEKELVLVAAYPAGFLPNINVQTFLYPVTTITNLGAFFTFTKDTLDLISLGGTAVSQQGSSGGGAIDDQGKAIALIVTSTEAELTGDRDLRAITFAHISRSLVQNVGLTLSQLLSKDPTTFAKSFNENTAPALTATLSAEYDKK